METTFNQRALIYSLSQFIDKEVLLRGWVYRLRVLAKTTFVVIRDCSGEAQCVAGSDLLKDLHLKLDDCVEIYGRIRADHRSRSGYEVDIIRVKVLSRSSTGLPFNSSSKALFRNNFTVLSNIALRFDCVVPLRQNTP
jgi:nondiscriminating aspartyl-tRNA synthetase